MSPGKERRMWRRARRWKLHDPTTLLTWHSVWKLSVLSKVTPSIFAISDDIMSHPVTHIVDGRLQSLWTSNSSLPFIQSDVHVCNNTLWFCSVVWQQSTLWHKNWDLTFEFELNLSICKCNDFIGVASKSLFQTLWNTDLQRTWSDGQTDSLPDTLAMACETWRRADDAATAAQWRGVTTVELEQFCTTYAHFITVVSYGDLFLWINGLYKCPL